MNLHRRDIITRMMNRTIKILHPCYCCWDGNLILGLHTPLPLLPPDEMEVSGSKRCRHVIKTAGWRNRKDHINRKCWTEWQSTYSALGNSRGYKFAFPILALSKELPSCWVNGHGGFPCCPGDYGEGKEWWWSVCVCVCVNNDAGMMPAWNDKLIYSE